MNLIKGFNYLRQNQFLNVTLISQNIVFYLDQISTIFFVKIILQKPAKVLNC